MTSSGQSLRIGVDGKKIPEAEKRGTIGTLQHARELGMEGVFFRTVLDMSPTLDLGELRDIRACADDLGMYLETGLGKANPYALAETPEVRAIGDGDTLLGFRRMMEACAQISCTELWSATANLKSAYRGRLSIDRFRTDVSWQEQLRSTEAFLTRLRPIALDLGVHINLETHEEITTFELVRLVEAVGPDAIGIVFDTANVLIRVEHPVMAARRVAPYVRQTHMKDAHVAHGEGGLCYQMRPFGNGVMPFDEILPILAEANPAMNLTIENAESADDFPRRPGPALIEVYDREFLAGHPDLGVEELAAYLEMVHAYEQRIASGEVPDIEEYAARPFGYTQAVQFITDSADHLRAACARTGLAVAPPR
ncbi:sugar phosphate isomerase/epimerase family protein [Streptomyces sp. NPDC046821]|uniref:sugar phosphate isomerase/epimerase family protein n=1 Tax=Streptomyces sp. NPDC046821 TaxID=3154702 RepID=UPI0033EA7F1C